MDRKLRQNHDGFIFLSYSDFGKNLSEEDKSAIRGLVINILDPASEILNDKIRILGWDSQKQMATVSGFDNETLFEHIINNYIYDECYIEDNKIRISVKKENNRIINNSEVLWH